MGLYTRNTALILLIFFGLLCTIKLVNGLSKPSLLYSVSKDDINGINNNFRIVNNTFDDIYLKLQKPENITIYTTTPTVSDLSNGELVFYHTGTLYGIAVKMNDTIKYFKSN